MTTFDNSNTTGSDVLLELTAELVAAYVSNNSVPAGDLPGLISDVHAALGRVGGGLEAVTAIQEIDPRKPEPECPRSNKNAYAKGIAPYH